MHVLMLSSSCKSPISYCTLPFADLQLDAEHKLKVSQIIHHVSSGSAPAATGSSRTSIENLSKIYRKSIGNLSKIYRKSIENLSKIYRTSIENLSKVYRKSLEHVSKIYRRSIDCLLYTSPSPRDGLLSRMPSSA